ncbi:MAG: hypothetical protein Ct9H300mP15_15990 [Gemmatimonadota bacterium]|nr:MAG: hypothetical protein Ct9H300mP15_15990 [Gemmatimonadota bacterium]
MRILGVCGQNAAMTDQTSGTVARLNAGLEGRYRIDRELGEGGMAGLPGRRPETRAQRVSLKVL